MLPSSEDLPSPDLVDSTQRAQTAMSAGAARKVAASVATSSSICIAIAKDDCKCTDEASQWMLPAMV
jgi:hypothetical protein